LYVPGGGERGGGGDQEEVGGVEMAGKVKKKEEGETFKALPLLIAFDALLGSPGERRSEP
jgi:hypothetical protein